jgi:hypothetical protein
LASIVVGTASRPVASRALDVLATADRVAILRVVAVADREVDLVGRAARGRD